MKTQVSLLIAFLFLSTAGLNQVSNLSWIVKFDYGATQLKGKVKFLKESRHSVVDSNGYFVCGNLDPPYHGSAPEIIIYEFDSNKNIRATTAINNYSDTLYKMYFHYSSNLIRDVQVSYGGKTYLDKYIRYEGNNTYVNNIERWIGTSQETYNKNGKMISRYSLDTNNRIQSHTYYFYDGKNYIMETDHFNEGDGSLVSRTIRKLDTIGGKRIEETRYDKDGSCTRQEKFKYDQQGNLVESSNCYFDSENACYTSLYQHDKYGKEIKKITYNKIGEFVACNISRYDSLQNLIFSCDSSMRFSPNCNCYQLNYGCGEYYHIYDNMGNVLEEGALLSLTRRRHCTYKYDMYNNMIEKIEYSDNTPLRLYKREIVYY